jgi:hypothetical protein
MRPMKKVSSICSSIGSYCPYTMLGRRAIQYIKGNQEHSELDTTDREQYLMSKVKSGLGISLIGVFCPIFWLSLISGAETETLYFNAAHSGIVILIGVIYATKYYIDLKREI